jgi:hypothetical protein
VLLIIAWADYKTNTDIAKKLNITAVLDKMRDCRRNWIQCINRMLFNRLPKIIKKLQTKMKKKPGETTNKTTVCMYETRTGQQVAQIDDSLMMMMMKQSLLQYV